MNSNPLVKYYTDPKTYVKLPSNGNFYNTPPQLSVDSELGVIPMTAVDEMLFQSPDNLLNGESLFKVIGRCVPGIENPKEIPNPDLDAILVGLRIATYGNEMTVTATCPNCSTASEYDVFLPQLLANVEMLDSEYVIQLNEDISARVKPFTVESSITLAIYAVEISQLQRAIMNNDRDDESTATAIREAMDKSSDHLVKLITKSIIDVTIKQGDEVITVNDPEHIEEWVRVLTVREYKMIRERIEEISSTGIQKTMNATCTECEHQWDVQIGVDPASFFDMR